MLVSSSTNNANEIDAQIRDRGSLHTLMHAIRIDIPHARKSCVAATSAWIALRKMQGFKAGFWDENRFTEFWEYWDFGIRHLSPREMYRKRKIMNFLWLD